MALSISHAFVSAKSDGGDATLVQPSNWNAQHSLSLATQRLVGRNTAGSGAAEEVTASQLFDWVSSTNGVLLTRTGGTWAALANVKTDSGDLVYAQNASPVAPSGTDVKLFNTNVGGRAMLAQLAAGGAKAAMQPAIAQQHIGQWLASGLGLTTFTTIGMQAPQTSGTATGRSPATTNSFTAARRIGLVSAGTAASVAGARQTANFLCRQEGFHVVYRWGISDASIITTGRTFVGLTTAIAFTDFDPSGNTQIVGVGCDANDTVLQLYAAGSAAQARVSLGVNFPMNTVSTDIYELALYCPKGGAISYQVTRLNTGDVASGTLPTGATVCPATTQLLTTHLQRTNGATATAVGVDLFSLYVETDI